MLYPIHYLAKFVRLLILINTGMKNITIMDVIIVTSIRSMNDTNFIKIS